MEKRTGVFLQANMKKESTISNFHIEYLKLLFLFF